MYRTVEAVKISACNEIPYCYYYCQNQYVQSQIWSKSMPAMVQRVRVRIYYWRKSIAVCTTRVSESVSTTVECQNPYPPWKSVSKSDSECHSQYLQSQNEVESGSSVVESVRISIYDGRATQLGSAMVQSRNLCRNYNLGTGVFNGRGGPNQCL